MITGEEVEVKPEARRALELFLESIGSGPLSLAYEPSYEEIAGPAEEIAETPDLEEALQLRALSL